MASVFTCLHVTCVITLLLGACCQQVVRVVWLVTLFFNFFIIFSLLRNQFL